jgi:hypothetical protein
MSEVVGDLVELDAVDVAGLGRRVEETHSAMAKTVDALILKLEQAASSEDLADFGALIGVAQHALLLDDLEMSRLLKVSRPTIGRWIRGFSVPHSLARRTILDVLAKKARSHAKLLRHA